MEQTRFSELAQILSDGASRRAAFRLLAGGAIGSLVGWQGRVENAAAKGKGKKKKKRKKGRCYGSLPVWCSPTASEPDAVCYPQGAVCCDPSVGGGACPPGEACCPPNPVDPEGSCAPPGSQCCPASVGGGYCAQFTPICCPPTLQEPLGLCLPTGFQCCSTAQGGGFCTADQTCCPPSPLYPNGSCAPAGVACGQAGRETAERHRHQERMMEPPAGAVARHSGDGRMASKG